VKKALLFLLLLLPLAAADGMYVPRPFSGSIFETHQLLAANLSESRADVSLFISMESNSTGEITYLFPFKEKPLSFSVEETNVSAFKKSTGMAETEAALKNELSYGTRAENVKNMVLLSSAALVFSPVMSVPFLFLGTFNMGARSGSQGALSFGASGGKSDSGLLETSYFSRGKLEVYNVSDTNIDYILSHYGADPSLKTKFKEYGKMRLFVLTVRPYESGLQSSLADCNDPEAALKLVVQDEINYNEWRYACPRISTSAHYPGYLPPAPCNTNSRSSICLPTVQELKGMAEGAPGFVLHYSLNLPDGEFWYPLGTGQFWENPIGITELQFSVPQASSLSGPKGFERVSHNGRAFYLRRIIGENPDYDMSVSIRGDYAAFLADSVKRMCAFLMEVLTALPLLVPFLGAFIGGAWLLRKERAANPAGTAAMLLFAYFVTSVIAAGVAGFSVLLASVPVLILFSVFNIYQSSSDSLLPLAGLLMLAISLGTFYFLSLRVAKNVVQIPPRKYAWLLVRMIFIGLAASAAFLLLYYLLFWLYSAL